VFRAAPVFQHAARPPEERLDRCRVLTVLALLYLSLLGYLTLISPAYQHVHPGSMVNLVPFRSILPYLRGGGWPMVVNILGNLAAFVPVGLLMPGVAGPASIPRVAAGGFVLSLAVEVAQYFQGYRVSDVDDLILNVAGALAGYAIYRSMAWGWDRVSTAAGWRSPGR
jgi:glycopeptide antibiotics resistance protein